MALRAEHPVFRRETFYAGVAGILPWKDIIWLTQAGQEIKPEEWEQLSFLSCVFSPETGAARYYLALNPAPEPVSAILPGEMRAPWKLLLDTSVPNGGKPTQSPAGHQIVPARSLILLYQDTV